MDKGRRVLETGRNVQAAFMDDAERKSVFPSFGS